MECPVCLLADDVDTDGARCVCGRLFHASCVYALLKNGYKTCPTCFARLPPNLFLLGASHGHYTDGSVLSTINFAGALTGANRARESLLLLRSIRPVKCTRLRALCSVEMGRALMKLGSFIMASRHLRSAVSHAASHRQNAVKLRAMAFLCRAYCDLGDHDRTKEIAALALNETPKLTATDAVYVMQALADSFLAVGRIDRHVAALRTICEIVVERPRSRWLECGCGGQHA